MTEPPSMEPGAAPLVYGPGFRTETVLRTGERVRLRTVHPGDREGIERGLRQLSPRSRIGRFFALKSRLSDAELSYLTRFDGIGHYALGAGVLDADGREVEGIGIGRFVRLPDASHAAEPAIVVVDAWQRRGVGRILLAHLARAARERGVRSFHAEFLAENQAVLRLAEGLGAGRRVQRRGAVVVGDFPLPDAAAADVADPGEQRLATPLRPSARRLLSLRPRR